MYLEYCPHVRSYQRGDASEACAKAYDLAVPLGTPSGTIIVGATIVVEVLTLTKK